ncbi:transcriptional repressor [Rubrobacter xylanophilus]|uniref:Transcriptional repressor n=1 Tax=Rubrobacter xylanophilus TaxID=49319 RepID=A0A510HF74_9ACTN|nr:transcriptional repressor [Rubrobacter xylanophilus]BBL78599.1 transcriptional repressor [Rubrobacter xylanophilus]
MSIRRRTRQREAILAALRDAPGPLSAARIREAAEREAPGLGRATVYRALRALREEGLVSVVELPGEEPLYESSGRGEHHHFRCRTCGRVLDLPGVLFGVPEGTLLPGGHRVEECSLLLGGSCGDCLSGGGRTTGRAG